MKTPFPAAIVGAALGLSGCSSSPQNDLDRQVETIRLEELVRHVEIEVDDPDRGLPCRVVDRFGSGAPDILWRAEYERGFCQRKAEETLLVLRSRGWACRPLGLDDPRVQARPASQKVVASWSCLEGLEPVVEPIVVRPTVTAPWPTSPPPPKPERTPPSNEPPLADDAPLLDVDEQMLDKAVERDLAAIGQDIVGNSSALATARGDLNDDGIEDAVVVVTRDSDGEIPQRMLMAYLRNNRDFALVDIWILRPPSDPQKQRLALAIEDGKVQLGDCCDDRDGPTALVLNDRKLVYAEDG